MATTKTAVKRPKALKKTIPVVQKIVTSSSEELVVESLAAVSQVVSSIGLTLDVLVQKIENMAYHIIATEEVLAELVAANGLNLARVNARIRAKIAAGTDNNGNADQAIDVAASIASPLPHR